MLVTILLFLPLMLVAIRPVAAYVNLLKVIEGVPAYKWRHGSAPTAVGMVVGYYATHGYPFLVPGDASTQTEEVNQTIASQSNDPTKPRHFEEFCLPLDPAPGPVLPDRSEWPEGGHGPAYVEIDNYIFDCIADFTHTSRSNGDQGEPTGLHYGETDSYFIGWGFYNYVNSKNPSYLPFYREYSREYNTLSWRFLEGQINNDRPMVFVIDSDGTGKYEAVTVIGYKWNSTGYYYGWLDTSGDPEIKWYDEEILSGKPGYVVRAWSFGLKPKNPTGNIPQDTGPGGPYRISFDAQTQEVRVVFNIQLDGLDLAGSYDVDGNTVTGNTIRNYWEQGIEGIWSNAFDIIDMGYTYTIKMEVNWISPPANYDFRVTVVTGIGRSTELHWYTDVINCAYKQEDRVPAHEVGHFMGLYDEYDPALGAVVDPKNPIRDDGSIMGMCGDPRERHYVHILNWLIYQSGRTNLILAPCPFAPPPSEPVSGFSDAFGYAPLAAVGGPYIAEEGYPMDFDATGSIDLDGTIVSYQWDFGDGSPTSWGPMPTHTYEDSGVYTVTLTVTDDDGLTGMATTSVTVVDTTPPSVAMVNPPSGYALQDGVTFIAAATDSGSGVNSVTFSIREDDGGDGVPVGFEDIPGIHEPATDNWKLWFDTLQLQDGYYVVVVEATDNAGNVGSIKVPYSIRNWAVIELLPSTAKNKAGRTMPIKFSLRVSASVDPTQPFVYNEELTIKIYASSNPSTVLQTSTYGNGARNYRIAHAQYITNFKTLPTPKQYTVSVNRNTFQIGSFNFQTRA